MCKKVMQSVTSLTFGINYEYKTNCSSIIFTRCLINKLIISEFQNFILKVSFSVNTLLIHFLMEYKDGYNMHYMDFIVYCALDKFCEFGNLE